VATSFVKLLWPSIAAPLRFRDLLF